MRSSHNVISQSFYRKVQSIFELFLLHILRFLFIKSEDNLEDSTPKKW